MEERQICTNCGHIGYSIKKRAGITILEIVLWVTPIILFFFGISASNNAYNLAKENIHDIYNWFSTGIYNSSSSSDSLLVSYRQEARFLTITGIVLLVIALIYSIWRTVAGKLVCPECKKSSMIPLDSPMGEKLHQEFNDKK